tara:strand:- start:374 stop:808 length:435 start_codon:yes stop_codon:yes gene_type:complete
LEPVNLWNKALDLLSRREHSVSELRTKLKKFSEDSTELENIIKRLKDSKFLDDKKFSESFVISKSKSGYGPHYIEQYLRKKGVNVCDFDMYSYDIDWAAICNKIYIQKSKGKKLNQKEKEKILRFLAYRGFSYEIIKNVPKDIE